MNYLQYFLILLFYFSLQSCSGGDSGYITIDKEQPNETKKTDTSQNNNQNNGEGNNDGEKNKEEEEDDKEGEDYENSENNDSGNNDGGNNDGENNDSGNNDGGNNDGGNNDGGNNDGGNNDGGNNDGGNNDGGNNDGGNNKNNPFSYGPIPITPNGNINSSKAYLYIDQISTDGIAHQSAACYGDYAFFISNKMINVMVYNMRTNQKIFTLKQNPLGTGTIYHCNQACFGTQKYSEEDPFPLLYISQFQNKNNRCFITVFRILPTSADGDQEYTAFSFERIQTIFFPVATDENCLNNANAVIDTDHHFIYTYSRNNNSAADNFRKCKISKFNLPKDIISGTIYLTNNDILDSFFINTSAINMQGGAYHDGQLYIGRGAPAVSYVNLYIIDLVNQKLCYTIDLLNNGYTWEPEGAYFYNNDLYFGASKRIFKFSFKNENSSAKAIVVPFNMTE